MTGDCLADVVSMGRYGGRFASRESRVLTASGAKLGVVLKELETELAEADIVDVMEAEKATHYRQRCRFSVVGSGNSLSYTVFDGLQAASIESFELASDRINALMLPVRDVLRESDLLSGYQLRAVHFHAPRREASPVMLSLVYGCVVERVEAWLAAAASFRAKLALQLGEVAYCVGRWKGTTLVSGGDSVVEELALEDGVLQLEFPEGVFSHPNTRANERSVEWLRSRIRAMGANVHLLELFCGAGNHTAALAPLCSSVLAVEIDASLVSAAQRNLERNHVDNARVLQRDAGRFSHRLYCCSLRNNKLQYNAVLVDPPRRGLDDATRRLIRDFQEVLYVSCNPNALQTDAKHLADTHKIAAFAALDAFPTTPHYERQSCVSSCRWRCLHNSAQVSSSFLAPIQRPVVGGSVELHCQSALPLTLSLNSRCGFYIAAFDVAASGNVPALFALCRNELLFFQYYIQRTTPLCTTDSHAVLEMCVATSDGSSLVFTLKISVWQRAKQEPCAGSGARHLLVSPIGIARPELFTIIRQCAAPLCVSICMFSRAGFVSHIISRAFCFGCDAVLRFLLSKTRSTNHLGCTKMSELALAAFMLQFRAFLTCGIVACCQEESALPVTRVQTTTDMSYFCCDMVLMHHLILVGVTLHRPGVDSSLSSRLRSTLSS